MRERVRNLLVIYGLLLAAAAGSNALKSTRPKFKIATTSTSTTTTEEPEEPEESEVTTVQTDVNATTARVLTGIPQIDYVWDPNLPRELNGFNLSTYPFYSSIPPLEEIDFKCDGLHDGFYASIQHKCQVYHHCLYGTRYDFLCANFTAFDQKTFICHFASEVDCANSKKYWHRNDALYQATTTTTTSTTTTPRPLTTAAPLPPARPSSRDRDLNIRRRRPFRRRPAYDYYADDYYDEEYDRTRPRGYDRRDSYEYDDRNYRADRDRDRDYRDSDRDHNARPRDRNNSPGYGSARDSYDDRTQRDREKIPAARPNRRDRRPIDQFDDDARPLARERPRASDTTGYPDEKDIAVEERRKDLPDLRARESPRDTDDRRYSDKRYRNDYEDKDPAPVAAGNSEGLVKPVAPSSSVYARPRAPPKIRRPVPISEQTKYAYNVTSAVASPTPTEEPRRRPVPVDDDYLEDELEDVRPRRPGRRRPAYRDKDPYDARDTRDRDRDADRDRNYRTRYQNEDEDAIIPRKRPDRQRDRPLYDRGDRQQGYDRDRSAPASPTIAERPAAVLYPSRSAERPSGPTNNRPLNRDEDFPRPKFSPREREPPVVPSEAPKKPNYYQRTEKTLANSPAQTFVSQDDEEDDTGVADGKEEPIYDTKSDEPGEKNAPEAVPEQPLTRVSPVSRGSQKYEDSSPTSNDYAAQSSSEYYDEPEEIPSSSPRTALRIVKRPFLPSRGGNPNPRGLKQVGLRVEPRSEEDRSSAGKTGKINTGDDGVSEVFEDRNYNGRRQPYDAYRTVQTDGRQQFRDEATDEGAFSRPQTRRLQKGESPSGQEGFARSSNREQSVSEDLSNRQVPGNEYSRQSSQLTNGRTSSQTSGNQDTSERPQPNEVASRLQDIPESEYDVTLNDALTPTLSQESSLPSGFILPINRQFEKDTNLQSSQRNYLFARPTETILQQKSLPQSVSSSSFAVPPILERSRTTFPRQPQGNIFSPGPQQATWPGYVAY